MTVALVAALAALGRQDAPATLPLGTSAEFAQAALAVESRLAAGDLEGAREAVRALPVRTPRVVWEGGELLPSNLQPGLRTFVEGAISRWNGVNARLEPTYGSADAAAPDLVVRYVRALPKGPDGLPRSVTIAPGPPFEVAIGLTRGVPGVPTSLVELNKEAAYAVGRYLGVPDSPFSISVMHVDPRPGLGVFPPAGGERSLVAENLRLADRLREAVATGKPLGLAAPAAGLARTSFDLGTVDQGAPLSTTFEIRNEGTSPLEYRLQPDCGCFKLQVAGRVAPGERKEIPIGIDVSHYVGRQDKLLLLTTNDPARTQTEIPVTFRVRPPYRLFRPGGDRFAVPAVGGGFDYFLFTPSPVRVLAARIDGFPAKAVASRWSGPLADADMDEAAQPREGWRVHVQVPPNLPAGRSHGVLTVKTDSPGLGSPTATLDLQKGIVADDVDLGDARPGATAQLLVDRPNAPFRILGIDAGPLEAKWTSRRGGWEYLILLKVKPNAPKGDLFVPLRIRTDDPKQPVVEAAVRGFVR